VTPRNNVIIVRAVCWLMTSLTAGVCCQSSMPSELETLRISRGATRSPSLGKTE
jgi:hypothetical protein